MSGDRQSYVAPQRLRPEDVEAVLELRRTVDGGLGLLAYTSLDLLVAGCGPAQPWVAVPVERVSEVAGLSGADTVVWDAGPPVGEW